MLARIGITVALVGALASFGGCDDGSPTPADLAVPPSSCVPCNPEAPQCPSGERCITANARPDRDGGALQEHICQGQDPCLL